MFLQLAEHRDLLEAVDLLRQVLLLEASCEHKGAQVCLLRCAAVHCPVYHQEGGSLELEVAVYIIKRSGGILDHSDGVDQNVFVDALSV